MKQKIAIIFTSLFMLISSSILYADQSPILLTTGEWAPYVGKSLPENGVTSEIITEVFKEMGIRHQYKFLPWKRAELLVSRGKSFAAYPYVKTPEREKEFYFSDRIAYSTGRFFFIKSKMKKITYEKLEDLSQFKIGGALGYWYEKKLQAVNPKYQAVKLEETNIKKLMKGRIELTPIDELTGWLLIKQIFPNQVDQFDTLDKPLNQSELYLMVSKDYPDAKKILSAFNKSLNVIRKKGIYDKILKKYGIRQ